MRKTAGYHSTVDWSVLTDPDANLGDDARAELARLDRKTRTRLSQTLGTNVRKEGEEMIRPWFSRGADAWGDVDVYGAEMRAGVVVLHFIVDHYNYNVAQSGSDWADLYVFVGEAHLADGKLEHKTLVRERHVQLSEHADEAFHRRNAIDAVRAEMRAKLRGAAPGKAAVEKAVDDDTPASSDARTEWEKLMAAGRECLWESKNYDKAVEHYEAAAKLAESFGSQDVALGHTLLQLARARAMKGLSAGESLLTRALAILDANLQPDRPEVSAFLKDFVFWHPFHADPVSGELRSDEAARLMVMKGLLTVLEPKIGLLHEQTTSVVRSLAWGLRFQDRRAEADELCGRWLQAASGALREDDLRVIEMVEMKADNLLDQGHALGAEALYRRALRAREIYRTEAERAVGNMLLKLGVTLTRRARYKEAEKLLRRCLAMADQQDSCKEADALADVLEKTGRKEEALRIRTVAWNAWQSYQKD